MCRRPPSALSSLSSGEVGSAQRQDRPTVTLWSVVDDLVQPLRLAHGRLDVQDLDVLPVLLEQRDKEVDGELEVLQDLLLRHTHVANGGVQAQDLLELELDSGLGLVDLGGEVLRLLHEGGELARLVEAGAEQTRDLLDQRLRGKEVVVLLGELLDHLLVLVEVLQTLSVLEVQTHRSGLLAVEGVAKHAHAHLGARDVRQLDVASETLVLLRVVVLQADLQLDGLLELALLLAGALEHLGDALLHVVIGHLRHPAIDASPLLLLLLHLYHLIIFYLDFLKLIQYLLKDMQTLVPLILLMSLIIYQQV
mmetsp:Transcript_24653/g.42080  ORF Transcript_24653/g.42080 Transcript_24653/m.42080 type:complete len:308 (+) Transcript_24653:171-1094(+)